MAKPRGLIRRLLFIGGAIALLAAGSIAYPNAVVAYAAEGFEYQVATTVPNRRVAIVPGARVHQGKPFVHLTARLEAALSLYRLGRVKSILVSGNNTEAAPEVNAMRVWLVEHGVPTGDIWTDEGGLRTRETMNRAVSIFGVTDAVVCTEDVNMARALFLARQSGIDAVGMTIPSRLDKSRRYTATEALKITYAFYESSLNGRPTPPSAPPIAATVGE
jgi:vancomycin permeability regulator SanA